MVLTPKVEVRSSAIAGSGLYAVARIAKGEEIWRPDADEAEKYYHTMAEIKSWSEEEQKHFMNNAYLVGPDTYSGAYACMLWRRSARGAVPREGAAAARFADLVPRGARLGPLPQACASAWRATRASS